MVRTVSTMLKIGVNAPDFSLPNPSNNQIVTLSDFEDAPLLVVFSCNHCPYVIHILQSFADFACVAIQSGLAIVMINSNDIDNYPADSPRKMVELANNYDFSFPYVYDESQQVANAYKAACTPDFFLFDASHKLVYRGQYDASRPGNNQEVNGEDLKSAIDLLLNEKKITTTQIPSMGCNIKWRVGNEPDYF